MDVNFHTLFVEGNKSESYMRCTNTSWVDLGSNFVGETLYRGRVQFVQLQKKIVHESYSTPPHTVTVTEDLDDRFQYLSTHLDGRPKVLVHNEFLYLLPLS